MSDGQTDRQTDRRTDRKRCSQSCLVAAKNMKILYIRSLNFVKQWGFPSISPIDFNSSMQWNQLKHSWIETRTTRMPAFWDTPSHPMITHTSDSHQIPSQNETKSKLQIFKNYQKYKFWNKLHMRHSSWSCLIRCINMKWIQPEL